MRFQLSYVRRAIFEFKLLKIGTTFLKKNYFYDIFLIRSFFIAHRTDLNNFAFQPPCRRDQKIENDHVF